jgi:hypothetical protein
MPEMQDFHFTFNFNFWYYIGGAEVVLVVVRWSWSILVRAPMLVGGGASLAAADCFYFYSC